MHTKMCMHIRCIHAGQGQNKKCASAHMPHSGVRINASISDEHQPASGKGHQGLHLVEEHVL